MKLLAPVVMLLLVLCPMATAKVVEDFSKCEKDLIQNTPTILTGSQYKHICQMRNGVEEYATLYDTINKIPVYSAYQFFQPMTCHRKGSWYIEPQLDDQNLPDSMASKGTVPSPPRGNNQALNEDYEFSGYDRGHLAPVAHQNTQACADATFTLTNAAPQNPSFNSGQWREAERNVSEYLRNNCIANKYRVFIITGVVPGNQKIANRVTIPSYFWTAYYCIDSNDIINLSGGYYGKNINNPVLYVTLQGLETFLQQQYSTDFKVFKSNQIYWYSPFYKQCHRGLHICP